MGAWGSGAFDNDDADDWMIGLERGEVSIDSTLQEAINRGASASSSLNAEAHAAISLVACALDPAFGDRPDDEDATLFEGAEMHQALASEALPTLFGSDLAELWNGDPDWWGHLEALAALLAVPIPPKDARTQKERTPDGLELVAKLGLPQWKSHRFDATRNGDILQGPIGVSVGEYHDQAELFQAKAFVPEHGYIYWISDEGHLVRVWVDPKFRSGFSVPYPCITGGGPVAPMQAKVVALLEETLARVQAATHMEQLQDPSRAPDVPLDSSFCQVCSEEQWHLWAAKGVDALREEICAGLRREASKFRDLVRANTS